MKIARSVGELELRPRAVALGVFDGVHRGHQEVIRTLAETGRTATVITFDPHPRLVLGYEVQMLSSLERRLELLAAAGAEETLVLEFSYELQQREPEEFVDEVLRPIGAEVVVAGPRFNFGHRRRGDLELLSRLGLDVRAVTPVAGISSGEIRRLLAEAKIREAATLLGRPPEVEGTVVVGDERGGTLGFPTANLAPEHDLLVPAYGIYAGACEGYRAAISIGTNPHYGGSERRIEAHLLDFEGDLYGRRLVIQLWKRLRGEAVFASEAELVAQIARDVEEARAAEAPL